MDRWDRSLYWIPAAIFGFIVGMHLAGTWVCVIDVIFLALTIGSYLALKRPFFTLLLIIEVFVLIGNFCCNSLISNKLPAFRYRKNVELTLLIESMVEKPATHTIYGYAKILSAPQKLSPILNQRIYFILTADGHKVYPKQQIKVSTKLVNVTRNAKKGFSKFLFKNHIFLYCCDGKVLDVLTPASSFQRFCIHVRDKIFHYLELGVADQPQAGVLVGMLTGAKYKIDKSQRTDFCSAGVAHIFAISGLHIGIIAICLDKIFCIFLISRKLRAFPVSGLLWLYVSIIGPSPSSVRACLMVMFYYIALLLGRRPNVLAAFADSAFFHILYDPTIVYNISFLLSYCVVFGIIMLASPINKILRNLLFNNVIHTFRDAKFFKKMYLLGRKYFLENLCVSVATCSASLIISWEFFGQISCLTVLFNIFVIPLASLSIILGSLSIFCGILHLEIFCEGINNLAILPIALIEKCFDVTRSFHHGSINIDPPAQGLWLLSILMTALVGYFILSHEKRGKTGNHDADFCSVNSFNLRS